jgi:uncharacterized membrane protein
MAAPQHPSPGEIPGSPAVTAPDAEIPTGQPAAAGAHAAEQGLVTPDPLVDAVRGIESSTSLDPAMSVLDKVAMTVARPGTAQDVLTGSWLGHALHPLLTDVPLGMWMSASLLDILGGRAARPAARKLVGLGVAAAIPTAATGLAEWLQVDRASQRVGVVHASANSVGLMFYTASWMARRRGHHVRGAAAALAGGVAAMVGGYLGGHLTLARKAGTRDSRFDDPAD